MNKQAFSQSSYGLQEAPIRSSRQVEYDVFARVTGRLSSASRKRDANHPEFINSLYDNTKLWRALAVDVLQAENSLPKNLKAQIFYLFQFTESHSRKVMSENFNVEILLEINKAVMRGLRGEGEGV